MSADHPAPARTTPPPRTRAAPRQSTTHCPYCALQCSTVLSGEAGGVTVAPSPDFPVNQGGLCQKGWTAPAVLGAPDRLRTPLVRGKDGELAPASWDDALDLVAAKLTAIRAEHGADGVAVFGGGGLTNEKAYTLGKFARLALGTAQIDYNGRFCMSSAAAAAGEAFGLDRGLPFPVTDLGDADVVLLAGANPAETMPPLMRHLHRPDLVVIDPRRTRTAQHAALHLQPAPGTDLALALGLLHLAVTENLIDIPYIETRTTGFEEVWASCVAWWPERVEQVTGVPAHDQRTAVRMLTAARRAYLLTGRGAEQHSKGSDTVAAFINLALALGLPGREGSGFGTLTGQGNGQGGREMGQKADQLPGYRSLTDPADRAHVARVWGVDAGTLPGPGRSAYELLDALATPDGPKALLVFGSNPVVSAPRAARITGRLSALDLLVVADFVPSETAALADVVLPVAQWAEEEGTLTSLEGRVLRRRAHLSPPPGTRTDLQVLHQLAVRLGQPAHRFSTRPREVFEELRRATAGSRADYSGISYERLDAGEALHWPCPATDGGQDHPGTPRPFLDRFAHPDGRARFTAVDHRPPAQTPDDRFPLYATTGRVLAHYQSGAQTRRVPDLLAAAPEAVAEMHPDTARHHRLADGQLADVASAYGTARVRVRLTSTVRRDTVFVPFHYPGAARANLLTGDALDPRSRMPEFKVSAVRVTPAGEQP
ncbi:molybdopterin oxidoreductase family protein [Streptomyces europaeiscabiei]|uniref:molybdopterin oxidoreductase family protein n=1 Tax=Streptomyces europaeiscabiei TaxID=146819 RepID=UPI0029A039BE|nr:molybdopterin oxidoreductase family protein [Streptomyces europaeiscabiei]MDX3848608.1 molybdopterin oxidoreductase family protein [Streptomyces europaeiscabiei]